MSFKRLVAAAAVSMFVSAGPAQASFTNLGTVFDGQFGSMLQSGNGGVYTNTIIGILPAHLKITFQYTLGALTSPTLSESSNYGFSSGGHLYSGFSYSDIAGTNFSNGTVDGNPSTSLVVTTANLGSPITTTSVTNNSDGNVSFLESLFGILAKGKAVFVSYTVSSVPLPAMAPLFGAALAALGFAARRKANTAA